MHKSQKKLHESSCTGKDLQAVKDALYVLQGKWRLPILISILGGFHRFNEIARNVEGISDRMLSTELKKLEDNYLVSRELLDTFPPTVEYHATSHTYTLTNLVTEMRDWGHLHRLKVIKEFTQD